MAARGRKQSPGENLEAKLYDLLSAAGHSSRRSMGLSISHSLREFTVGPTNDWGVRAYYVAWAGAVLWEIIYAVGHAFGVGLGAAFHEEYVAPMLERLAHLDTEHPLPQEHLRNSPLEFEYVEE